jgi:hypothetical protein
MAKCTWIGGAPAVAYREWFSVASTWAEGDTISVEIDGVVLTMTVGSVFTGATIAENFVKAWNGEELDVGYEVNFFGTQSPRHYQLEAEYTAGAAFYLFERAGVNGLPIEGKTFPSLTLSETSASGTFSSLGVLATPTGPHDYENADNWVGGAVGTDGDEIIFSGPYACKYNLDQSAAIDDATIRIKASMPQLGLPRLAAITLPGGTTEQFVEYRERRFVTAAEGTTTWTIGEGSGTGPNFVGIHPVHHANTVARIHVVAAGAALDETTPVFDIVGGGGGLSELKLYAGSAAMCLNEEDPTTSYSNGLWVTSRAGQAATSVLVIGSGYLSATPGVFCKGGVVTVYRTLEAAAVLDASDGGTINYLGGTTTGMVLRAYGGRINVDMDTGTITAIHIAQGSAGFLGSVLIAGGFIAQSLTITNCKLYSPGVALVVDGHRSITFTNHIVIANGLLPEQVTISVPNFPSAYTIQREALP